ncbi:ankyrin repeat domain-containing protein [Gynuella sunshinyii]|uniref:Ankyrin repeat n=1 Tax=Gynuella sunshinyii YC6258 TaxID=1445510 RepID=A0A0C5VR26_9GAMM|nr:ankyrin repeat domain-containing protein [Gynuella sunshinyii]AJQ96696.1 ankyrin repeat [Gynuella sunshinyii YC6258]
MKYMILSVVFFASGLIRAEGLISDEMQAMFHADEKLQQYFFIAARDNDVEMLWTFFDYGYPINDVDNEGHTALMIAVYYGSEEAVQVLLDAGADPNIRDVHGHNAFKTAISRGDLGVAYKLLGYGCTNTQDEDDKIYAGMFAREELLQELNRQHATLLIR